MGMKSVFLTEGHYTGAFVASEANGKRSREVVRIAGPIKFEPGTILAATATAGVYAPYDYRDTATVLDEADGIAWQGVDLKAGEVEDITVIKRDAEVIERAVFLHNYAATNPTNADWATAWGQLEVIGIVKR